MNKIIKEELAKCRSASIPPFDDDTTYLFIPKQVKILPENMLSNHAYLIRTSNASQSDSLAANWNHGRKPLIGLYVVENMEHRGDVFLLQGRQCERVNGKEIIYADGMWYGYLTGDMFEVLAEV